MTRLTAQSSSTSAGTKAPEELWDEHDYERLLRESDARTDKYMELVDKYGDSDEAEAKIAREMGGIASSMRTKRKKNAGT